ncbi:MAG: hypothetical protein OXH85_05865 [Truepera sp.]|nr:hypothetical protein [Truepera sp.]
MTDSSGHKEARRARCQEGSRARTVALLEECCRQNERFHGEDTAWQIQLDKVASQLVYKDGLAGSGPESARMDSLDLQHPGN